MEQTFCSANTPEENLKMQNFFNSLPPYVQENIRQAGMHFTNVQDLKNCADHITQNS